MSKVDPLPSEENRDGKERNRQINATINVNIHVDRNMLTGKLGGGKAANESITMIKQPSVAVNVPKVDGIRFSLGNVQTSPKEEFEDSKKISDLRLVTIKNISPVRTATDSTGSTTSGMLKAERSAGPSNVPSDERTQRIWLVDDNENKGGVKPILEPVTQKTAIVNQPKQASIAGDVRPKGLPKLEGEIIGFTPMVETGAQKEQAAQGQPESKPLLVAGQQPTENKELKETPANGQRSQLSIFERNHQWTDVMVLVVACAFIPFIVILAPLVISYLCCALTALIKSWRLLNLIIRQILCDFSNELCQVYGVCCTEYCASGLQMAMWNRGPL